MCFQIKLFFTKLAKNVIVYTAVWFLSPVLFIRVLLINTNVNKPTRPNKQNLKLM